MYVLIGLPLMLFFFLVVGVYNRLVTKRNEADNAMGQIEIQLNRRYDLIPNLVAVAKKYMLHEQTVLTAVTQARDKAVCSQVNGIVISELQHVLVQSLTSLYARFEAYPKLKADEQMKSLHEELKSTENRVAFARQYFNDAVTDYNNALQVFPNNIFAGMFGFKLKQILDLPTVPVPEIFNTKGEK